MILCHRCGAENEETSKNCSACLGPLRSRVSSAPASPQADADNPYASVERRPKPVRQATDSGVPNNVFAVPSLICGIIGLWCCPLSLPAIILGHLGLKFAREQEGEPGQGMSKAGLILGYIGVAFLAVRIIFGIVAALAQ